MISNKYGALNNLKETEAATPIVAEKKIYIPSIIVNTNIQDYKKFIENISKTLGHNNFMIKINKDTIKINVKTIEDHKKLIKDLHETEIESYVPQYRRANKEDRHEGSPWDVSRGIKADFHGQQHSSEYH